MCCVLLLSAVASADEEGKKKDGKTEKRGVFDFGYGSPGFDIGDHGSFDFPSHGFGATSGHHGEVKAITITKEVKVAVPQPYPVTVERKIPVPFKVPVPVPIDRPYPVHVPQPYPVPVEKPVPYPVEKPVPYPVSVPIKVPVPVEKPIFVENKVLPLLTKGHDSFGAHEVGGSSFSHGGISFGHH